MPRLSQSVPKYRRHRASGQALVTLAGRDHYLGPWQSKASLVEYDRLIGEWLVRGRQPAVASNPLTIVELLVRYWRFAKEYYVKDGRPTGELANIRDALRPLKSLYGHTTADDFRPLCLKAIRLRMIDAGLCRSVINARIRRIKRVFRWAVAEELIGESVYNALAQVEGLQKGRSLAREAPPVEPVADEIVTATLPHLPPIVADMVRFQRLTGCRPAEVCVLRPCDVDRSSEVWAYKPARHKMEHEDRERIIFIGPQAQALLRPYLQREERSFCFSPAEGERLRKETVRARRKTKVQPSQQNRKKPAPQRTPGERYYPASYRTAVHRGCDKAFGEEHGPIEWEALVKLVRERKIKSRDMLRAGARSRWKLAKSVVAQIIPKTEAMPFAVTSGDWYYKAAIPRWSPNQLRHAAATELRNKFGIEAAQVVLGHAKCDTTEIYAERDISKAKAIMRQLG